MASITYTVDGHVAVVTLNEGENRFNPDFLSTFLDVLNQIEASTECQTMVVTGSHEKIFSNGIDLEWLVPVLQRNDGATAKQFFYQLNRLFKRLVTYPMITVAAISGHAFAGGAIMSCAFDFRFMRSDRGFFCLPEVDLGIPFLPGMNALLKKAIPMHMLEIMQYTGKRLTAEECKVHHIVTQACHRDDLMREVLEFAQPLKKNRAVVKELKKRLTGKIVHAIDVEDVPYIESGRYNIALGA
jgi:enoyl-CoA hydratase/carnithine racemase